MVRHPLAALPMRRRANQRPILCRRSDNGLERRVQCSQRLARRFLKMGSRIRRQRLGQSGTGVLHDSPAECLSAGRQSSHQSSAKKNTPGADGVTRNYTSARLKTQGKFSQKYGRFEARIKIPSRPGHLARVLDARRRHRQKRLAQVRRDRHHGKHRQGAGDGSRHHSRPGLSGDKGIGAAYESAGGQRFADDFHIYAVEWEPKAIRFYVDDHSTRRALPPIFPRAPSGSTTILLHSAERCRRRRLARQSGRLHRLSPNHAGGLRPRLPLQMFVSLHPRIHSSARVYSIRRLR